MPTPSKMIHKDKSNKRFWQIFLSAATAAFGVQSNKNREQDFSHSSPLPYILAGLVFTIIFILVLVVVVNMAIS